MKVEYEQRRSFLLFFFLSPFFLKKDPLTLLGRLKSSPPHSHELMRHWPRIYQTRSVPWDILSKVRLVNKLSKIQAKMTIPEDK